jgi:hypothetical protein
MAAILCQRKTLVNGRCSTLGGTATSGDHAVIANAAAPTMEDGAEIDRIAEPLRKAKPLHIETTGTGAAGADSTLAVVNSALQGPLENDQFAPHLLLVFFPAFMHNQTPSLLLHFTPDCPHPGENFANRSPQ